MRNLILPKPQAIDSLPKVLSFFGKADEVIASLISKADITRKNLDGIPERLRTTRHSVGSLIVGRDYLDTVAKPYDTYVALGVNVSEQTQMKQTMVVGGGQQSVDEYQFMKELAEVAKKYNEYGISIPKYLRSYFHKKDGKDGIAVVNDEIYFTWQRDNLTNHQKLCQPKYDNSESRARSDMLIEASEEVGNEAAKKIKYLDLIEGVKKTHLHKGKFGSKEDHNRIVEKNPTMQVIEDGRRITGHAITIKERALHCVADSTILEWSKLVTNQTDELDNIVIMRLGDFADLIRRVVGAGTIEDWSAGNSIEHKPRPSTAWYAHQLISKMMKEDLRDGVSHQS